MTEFIKDILLIELLKFIYFTLKAKPRILKSGFWQYHSITIISSLLTSLEVTALDGSLLEVFLLETVSLDDGLLDDGLLDDGLLDDTSLDETALDSATDEGGAEDVTVSLEGAGAEDAGVE